MDYWTTPLLKAAAMAEKAHKGQTRWGGESYYEAHIMPVAEACGRLYGGEEMVVAYLHDIVEDTSVTLNDLRSAGFDGRVIDAVDAITKRYDEESYARYLERLGHNFLATRVKEVDIKHNMSDLGNNLKKHKQRRDKYAVALLYLASIK